MFSIFPAVFPSHKHHTNFVKFTLLLFPLILISLKLVADEPRLPAFPGAEGFGAYAKGGRGGEVIAVTNLNAKGPGSLRAACEAEGPRTIIFNVSGVIELKKNISIRHPYITIAGQTAPGDGICLRGGGLHIRTHDVVVRGLRIRVGDAPDGPHPESRDAIAIEDPDNPVHDVIIDHCSLSWATDENASTWHLVHNVTYQWCIISEGLFHSLHPKGGHSMGLLIGDHAKRVSVHHNLFAHNNFRNPSLKGDTMTEIANNVVYNWGSHAMGFSQVTDEEPSQAILIGNYFIPGPNSRIKFGCFDIPSHASALAQLYEHDNFATVDMNIANPRKDNRSVVVVKPPFEGSGLTIQPAQEAYELVLAGAGATHPYRDAVDQRIIADVKKGTGSLIDSQDEVGGWPNYKQATAPVDSDADGMPDTWETHYGFQTNIPNNNDDPDGDGYTNLEEYLNGTDPVAG